MGELNMYLEHFQPKKKNDEYSQDFMYLISLICAKIWFTQRDALGIDNENDLKDEDLQSYNLVNQVIHRCQLNKFKREDSALLNLEEVVVKKSEKMALKEEVMDSEEEKEEKEDKEKSDDDTSSTHKLNKHHSSYNALKTLKKAHTSFHRKKRLEQDGEDLDDNMDNLPLQWIKLCTLFVAFERQIDHAKQMITFDVDKALTKIEKGEAVSIIKQPFTKRFGKTLNSRKIDEIRSHEATKKQKREGFEMKLKDEDQHHSSQLLKRTKTTSPVFTRDVDEISSTPIDEPVLEFHFSDNNSSTISQSLQSQNQLRILTRHLTKSTAMFYIKEKDNIKKILDGDTIALKMISILKITMEVNREIQKVIVDEMRKTSEEEEGISALIKSSLIMYLSKERKTKMTRNMLESAYLDSYAYYWIIRRDINFFVKNIAENNNMSGKLMFFKLEPQTNLMKIYLRDLMENLEEVKVDRVDLALQRW
jgi:hypothetical protein